MGSIYRQFGIFWDDSFRGNVQYFDGLKLRSDYGVSLEDTPDFKDDFKIDRYFQFFVAQSRISGAILGADSDSFAGSEMRNTFIGRVVPTWKLGEKQTFALGFSATVGANRQSADAYRVFDQSGLCRAPGTRPFPAGPSTGLGPAALGSSSPRSLNCMGSSLPAITSPAARAIAIRTQLRGSPTRKAPWNIAASTRTAATTTPTDAKGCSCRELRPRSPATSRSGSSTPIGTRTPARPLQNSVLENGYQLIVDWHF